MKEPHIRPCREEIELKVGAFIGLDAVSFDPESKVADTILIRGRFGDEPVGLAIFNQEDCDSAIAVLQRLRNTIWP